MPIEMFYRMRASVLAGELVGIGTVAEAIARWHADPWYDGPDVGRLLEELGAEQTYYGELGGLAPGALGFPPRLVERVAAVARERGPWPYHPREPEPFRDLLGVMWVAPGELAAAHRALAAHAARRFAEVPTWTDDPDRWLDELDRWLDPPRTDDVEVWLFEVVEPEHGERGRPYQGPTEAAGRPRRPPPRQTPWATLLGIAAVVFLATLGLWALAWS